MQILIKKRSKDFNKEAITLYGVTTVFYAGSYSIKAILSGWGLNSLESIGSLFFYFWWGYALVHLIKKNWFLVPKILMVEFLYVVILLLNKLIFPYSAVYYQEYSMFLRQIIITFIPCGVVLSNVDNFENWILYLEKYAYIGMIMMSIAYPLGYLSRWDEQYWGVQLSPFILIFYQLYLTKRNIKYIIYSFLGILLLMIGGRQSFIIVSITMIILYIYQNRKKSVKKLLFFMCGCGGALFLISGVYSYIAKGILSIFSVMGIEPRTLSSIASGDLFDFSTRIKIYQTAWDCIVSNKTAVSGLFGDRHLLREIWPWMSYAHNFVLEILMDFGYLFGSILLFVCIALIIKNLRTKNEASKQFTLILVCLAMIRLMVSSSFLIEGYFYIMLGVLLRKKQRYENRIFIKKI